MSNLVPYKKSLAYRVFNNDTGKIIYEGANLVKTIGAIYSGYPTSVTFNRPINAIFLSRAIELQEILN